MPEHRILADEHISKTVVAKLKSYGIDTVHVTEENLRGSPDTELAQFAFEEERIILTRDDDSKIYLTIKKSEYYTSLKDFPRNRQQPR